MSNADQPDKSSREQSLVQQLIPFSFYSFIKEERIFIGLLGIFFFAAGISFPYAHIAMWVGFFFAGYSAIANDSIQTIGTFLASNQDKPWWMLWIYIGGIFFGHSHRKLDPIRWRC